MLHPASDAALATPCAQITFTPWSRNEGIHMAKELLKGNVAVAEAALRGGCAAARGRHFCIWRSSPGRRRARWRHCTTSPRDSGRRASPFRPTRPRALRRVCGGSMSASLPTPLHTARWRSKPPPTPKRSPALRTVHSAMPARWSVFYRTVCRNAHAPAAVHRGGGNLF